MMMRLAPEGWPQMAVCTLVLGGGAAALLAVGGWVGWLAVPVVCVWGWSILFFRDPRRDVRPEDGILIAPADGTIQDITELNDCGAIEGPAIRIGIFLSLFNVHINRSPLSGQVISVVYKAGRFLAAMNPLAGEQNESNTLVIKPVGAVPGPVVVRQIAGVAARRIVCHAMPGDALAFGARFGLIKFGSRTELIVPKVGETALLVRVGDTVRAGLTPMVRQPAIAPEESDGQDSENARRPAEATA